MADCLAKITTNLLTILKESGHFVFQNGHYEDCLQTKGFSYTNVQLGVGDVNYGIYMGLCLPAQCTESITKQLLDGAMIAVGLPYNVVSINQHIQDYSFPINWVFFITLLILLSFSALFIAGSLLKDKIGFLRGFNMKQSLKIFKYNDISDLNVFNGIRSLAMMWVVFGHYYLNSSTGVVNTFFINQIFAKPFFLLVQAGLLSVDVFFFLGGFFLAFVFLREKSNSIAKYFLAIVQRLLRIWPAYVFTMMFYYSIFMQLGSGPRWPSNGPVVNICKNMWRSIFFLQNLIDNGEEICVGWGWYLQVDFQLFLACLVILFLYSRNKIVSLLFTGALIVGSFAININYTQEHEQKLFTDIASLLNFQNYFVDMYIKPYARCTPYFIGLFAGIAYFEFAQKTKEGRQRSSVSVLLDIFKEKLVRMRLLRWIMEAIGLGIMAFLVFIPRTLQDGGQWPQIWHSLYFCLSKPFFIFGMLLVILPPLLGIKSFFRTILDTSLFNFIAKISFCTYLLHLIVIYQFYTSRAYDFYYSIIDGFIIYAGCLVLSCLMGFILTMLIELPCAYYQKALMKTVASWNKRKESLESTMSGQRLQRGLINNTVISEQK